MMAFECTEKKRLLYADLFKGYKRETQSTTLLSPNSQGSSSWSSSQLSAWDSSSSGFSTPFGSELGSSEGEDGDIIAELTRQMAEGMLRDEESEDSDALKNLCPSSDQVYEVRDPPPSTKQARSRNTRGGRRTESGQQKLEKTEQNYRGKVWRNGLGEKNHHAHSSRMRAIFLRNGSSGTGVYLPRVTNELVELKKKQGCSTVLIPTRVLEILELHYSNRVSSNNNSGAPSLLDSTNRFHDEWRQSWVQPGRNLESQIEADVEMHLPQEWTY